MRIEKQKIPSSTRTRINQRFRNYQMELDGYRRRIQQLADGRSALFGAPYRDNPADAKVEQRQPLLAGTERLDRSTLRLMHFQALAFETVVVGASTLADLEIERKIIKHSSDVLLES